MKRWLSSFFHACRGIIVFIRQEPNARIEIAIAIFTIGLSFLFQISLVEFAIILLCFGGVLASEAFNSAIERSADFQTSEIQPDIRDIKDMSAGAVLIWAFISLIIGMIIFVPKIWSMFFG